MTDDSSRETWKAEHARDELFDAVDDRRER